MIGGKEDKEKEPINIEFGEQKQILIIMKLLLTWNDRICKKKKLLKLTSLKAYKCKLMKKIPKK